MYGENGGIKSSNGGSATGTASVLDSQSDNHANPAVVAVSSRNNLTSPNSPALNQLQAQISNISDFTLSASPVVAQQPVTTPSDRKNDNLSPGTQNSAAQLTRVSRRAVIVHPQPVEFNPGYRQPVNLRNAMRAGAAYFASHPEEAEGKPHTPGSLSSSPAVVRQTKVPPPKKGKTKEKLPWELSREELLAAADQLSREIAQTKAELEEEDRQQAALENKLTGQPRNAQWQGEVRQQVPVSHQLSSSSSGPVNFAPQRQPSAAQLLGPVQQVVINHSSQQSENSDDASKNDSCKCTCNCW